MLEKCCDFFIKNRFSDQNEWYKIKQEIRVAENEYLKKFGESRKFEIEADKAKQMFDELNKIDLSVDPIPNIILLTHKNNNGEIISYWEEIGSKQKNGMLDNLNLNRGMNDYFFYSKLLALDIHNETYFQIIGNYYLKQTNFDYFFDFILSEIGYVFKKNNIELDENEMIIPLNSIKTFFKKIIVEELHNKSDKLPYHLSCFNILFSECCIIEKVLREIYLAKYNNEFLNTNYLTLGIFLSPDSVLNEILGINCTKIIKYYLNDSSFGYNLRNKICHFNFNYTLDETLNYKNCLLLLYIILVILNSFYINCQEK